MLALSELYRGVKSIVVHESGGKQTPWLTRNEMFGDFGVF
jgi:hypothetical protein